MAPETHRLAYNQSSTMGNIASMYEYVCLIISNRRALKSTPICGALNADERLDNRSVILYLDIFL